ncbi:MAG: thioredoxin domain-containing protein [Pseudomonadota bacterium]
MNVFRIPLILGIAAAVGAVGLTLASPSPSAAQSLSNTPSELIDDLPEQPWLSVTERTEKGHQNGNPNAEAHLIEFISYTCSGCAQFAKQSGGTLDLAAVGPGHISVEVRPVIRNSIDLVASLLAQCGDPSGFKKRHQALLYSQDTWWTKAVQAPQSQKSIWARETPEARINAATAIGLDATMRDAGLSTSQIMGCLRDETSAQRILADDKANRLEFAIPRTPSFAIDGQSVEGAHGWPSLSQALQTRFRPKAQVMENGRVTTVQPQ